MAIRRKIPPIVIVTVVRISQRVVHHHQPAVDALFVLVDEGKYLNRIQKLSILTFDIWIESALFAVEACLRAIAIQPTVQRIASKPRGSGGFFDRGPVSGTSENSDAADVLVESTVLDIVRCGVCLRVSQNPGTGQGLVKNAAHSIEALCIQRQDTIVLVHIK